MGTVMKLLVLSIGALSLPRLDAVVPAVVADRWELLSPGIRVGSLLLVVVLLVSLSTRKWRTDAGAVMLNFLAFVVLVYAFAMLLSFV